MRKLFLLAFALAALSISASAQSDCGNCWTVWVGCDPLAICDFQGLCDVCSYFIECDYAPCSTTQAQWACVCPSGQIAQVKESHARNLLSIIRRRNTQRTKTA